MNNIKTSFPDMVTYMQTLSCMASFESLFNTDKEY